jgi:hypothetical protein
VTIFADYLQITPRLFVTIHHFARDLHVGKAIVVQRDFFAEWLYVKANPSQWLKSSAPFNPSGSLNTNPVWPENLTRRAGVVGSRAPSATNRVKIGPRVALCTIARDPW